MSKPKSNNKNNIGSVDVGNDGKEESDAEMGENESLLRNRPKRSTVNNVISYRESEASGNESASSSEESDSDLDDMFEENLTEAQKVSFFFLFFHFSCLLFRFRFLFFSLPFVCVTYVSFVCERRVSFHVAFVFDCWDIFSFSNLYCVFFFHFLFL